MKRSSSSSSSSSSSKQAKVEPSAGVSTSQLLPFVPVGFNAARARLLTKTSSLNPAGKCVVLWMSRDQRADDNWALAYAQAIARAREVPLKVVFNLVPKLEQATLRQYSFMLAGLEECEKKLRLANVPFFVLMGDSVTNVPKFAEDHEACAVVTDFQALRVPRAWITGVATALDGSATSKIPLVQVDAHNIVPMWVASPKLEYSARIIRTKIQAKLPEFLNGTSSNTRLAPPKKTSRVWVAIPKNRVAKTRCA